LITVIVTESKTSEELNGKCNEKWHLNTWWWSGVVVSALASINEV